MLPCPCQSRCGDTTATATATAGDRAEAHSTTGTTVVDSRRPSSFHTSWCPSQLPTDCEYKETTVTSSNSNTRVDSTPFPVCQTLRFELPCLSVIRLDSLCQRKFAPCKIDHTLFSYFACIVRIVPFYCRFQWSSESLIRFIMSHHVRGGL